MEYTFSDVVSQRVAALFGVEDLSEETDGVIPMIKARLG